MISPARILQRLPAPLRSFITDAAREAKTPLRRAVLRASGFRATPVPLPPPLPSAAISVYIAPANYAAQGNAWARALERSDGTEAWSVEVRQPGGFDFPADRVVGLGPFHLSTAWQDAEFRAASQRTHVLVEAARSMFARRFNYDVLAEVRALHDAGVSVAMISHGSDLRSPAAQRELTKWSPFHDHVANVDRLQEIADRTRRTMQDSGAVLFVATPELLVDLPDAFWCPNVVDLRMWSEAGRELMERDRPTVVHVPTNPWIKGTPLVQPHLEELIRDQVIDYQPMSGVSPQRMREAIGDADFVLDQFRLGMYGTTAVESMAAGRVVIGHVAQAVREQIRSEAGIDVPIVEATPDTLDSVIRELSTDPDRIAEIGGAGISYARAVHDGTMSARVLRERWISPETHGASH